MNDASAGAARHTWIRERIAQVPRVRLALTPTPIEEAPNLSRALGGPRIFIKRDDLTGVAFGGNKLRNLEFRLARTMAEQPDTVVVGLDLQSNSARQTIGACNKLGLKTILVLEGTQARNRAGQSAGRLPARRRRGVRADARGAARGARRACGARTRSRRASAYPQRQSHVRCGVGAGLSGDDASNCWSRWSAPACSRMRSTCRRAARARPVSCLASV